VRRVAGLLALCLWGAAAAADPAERATQAARQMEAATEALRAATRRAERVDALGETVQAYEDGLAALRTGLRRARLRESELTARLDARSAELARLLAVLMGTERLDDAVTLVHPDGALAAARAAMALRDVTPALGAEVADLRAALQDIAALRRARQYGLLALEQGRDAAQDARVALSRAIAERGPLPKRMAEQPERMAALANSAQSLDAFARSLADSPVPQGDAALRGFRDARGTLALPVRGRVLRGFREPGADGIARPGLALATLPEALVTAPWAGTVRYAGPLAGRGSVAILEPAEDMLLVLVGLGALLVQTGAIVAQDTPLATMPPAPPDAQRGAGARVRTLYLELRQAGAPIDPAPWFDLTAADP